MERLEASKEMLNDEKCDFGNSSINQLIPGREMHTADASYQAPVARILAWKKKWRHS